MRSNETVEASALSSSLGRITIASDVVAQIVAYVAAEAYGVVDMAGGPGPLARLRGRRGIEIGRDGEAVTIDVRVVVEYGLNLAEVASTLRNRVTYEVERLTGLHVASVEVHITDVRRSA
jgi:uncharacterized alkaline shock family protein YloU